MRRTGRPSSVAHSSWVTRNPSAARRGSQYHSCQYASCRISRQHSPGFDPPSRTRRVFYEGVDDSLIARVNRPAVEIAPGVLHQDLLQASEPGALVLPGPVESAASRAVAHGLLREGGRVRFG